MILNSYLNTSPLQFLQSKDAQYHRVKTANSDDYFLICSTFDLIPFQIVLPYGSTIVQSVKFVGMDSVLIKDITTAINPYLDVIDYKGVYSVISYSGFANLNLPEYEGWIEIQTNRGIFYSEVIQSVQDLSWFVKIEFSSPTNIELLDRVLIFDKGHRNWLYLETELRAAEYKLQEEIELRDSMAYPKRRVLEKIFKGRIAVPEYVCDMLSLASTMPNINITTPRYSMIVDQFLFTAEWVTSLAGGMIEIHTNAIVINQGIVSNKTRRLSGFVRSEDGSPISGARVGESGLTGERWALTNRNGMFTFVWNDNSLIESVVVSKDGYISKMKAINYIIDIAKLESGAGQFIDDITLDRETETSAEWGGFVARVEVSAEWTNFEEILIQTCFNDYSLDYSRDYNCNSNN